MIENTMLTSEQYRFAQARIVELQNPALQPLGLALAWELNDLMTACSWYEEAHTQEVVESYGWPGDGSGEDDFADYNQNEGNDW